MVVGGIEIDNLPAAETGDGQNEQESKSQYPKVERSAGSDFR